MQAGVHAPPTLAGLARYQSAVRVGTPATPPGLPSPAAAAAQEEMKSTKEKGLYDYVIVNDNLERAFQELAAVAVRAVMGETGPPGAAPGAPSTSAAPGSSGSGTAVVSAAAAAADTPPRGGMLVKTRSLPKRGEVEEPKVCARARGGATRCLLPGAQLGGAAAARRMTPPPPHICTSQNYILLNLFTLKLISRHINK